MKKLFAVLMALCLMGSAALAETVTEINWNDVFGPAVEAGQVAGDFVTFDEIAVKIWLPEGLNATELTEEDRAKGFIGYFTDEKASATVAVQYVDVSGETLEDYFAELKNMDDVSEPEMVLVNGIPAVNYELPAQDSTTIAFATEAGYILEVTMAPVSAEGAEMVWGAVGASIQAAE